MSATSNPSEAGEYLRRTALRDFTAFDERADTSSLRTLTLRVPAHDAPVPRLLKYALELVGFRAGGPGEKVEWWFGFCYKGESCELSHEKFGVRLRLWSDAPQEQAETKLAEILKKLTSAVRTVERLILATAPATLSRGNATVMNQHHRLRGAYDYFRERAISPAFIEDETIEHTSGKGGRSWTYKSGKLLMKFNAFHDLVAAVTAYLSVLEHDLVLALAFTDFDPDVDNLTDFIGHRWGLKYDRVLGGEGQSADYRARLTAVVERWRNPYSHGGFEKGQAATLYLHEPNVGAIPVGLTNIRHSPHFSFVPASESDVSDVFAFLDELDGWIAGELPDATAWIRSGLPVRFDDEFRREAAAAVQSGAFDRFVRFHEYRQEMVDNMDD